MSAGDRFHRIADLREKITHLLMRHARTPRVKGSRDAALNRRLQKLNEQLIDEETESDAEALAELQGLEPSND